MKRTILSFLKYYIFWVCYFLLFKILFLLANFQASSSLSWNEIFEVFRYGFKMDLSAAGYLCLAPGIIFTLSPFIKSGVLQKIVRIYTLVILIIVTIAGLVDIALYPSWATRLSAQIFHYMSDPLGILASVTFWQILLFIFSGTLIVFVSYILFKRLFRERKFEDNPKWYIAPIVLALTLALLIPIRGGIGRSPLNFSDAYFSKNLYANHAAYNFFWAFNYDITHRQASENPAIYMSDEECEAQMKEIDLLAQKESPIYVKSKNGKPVNVILVILESFSNKVIESLGGLPGLTPRLDALCNQGITFPSFYATGSRSDKGISSILASYPALIKGSAIVRFPEKMKGLDYLGLYFKEHNYDLSFYYGGDVNFYNTRMLLLQSEIDHIVSLPDFPASASASQKWGAPDQYLYERASNDLLQKQNPFFSIIYTLSSHEPYDVPFERVKGNSHANKYLNSIAYADSCLGDFIDRLKESPMWDNTLIVITSDHATPEPGPTSIEDLETYRIPLLWVGGAIDTTFICDHIGMQTDLSATLINQMGWEHKPSYFSKNIFGMPGYAFYYRGREGWGFVSPEIAFFMNREYGYRRFFYGNYYAKKDSIIKFADGFTQFLHDDFLKR